MKELRWLHEEPKSHAFFIFIFIFIFIYFYHILNFVSR